MENAISFLPEFVLWGSVLTFWIATLLLFIVFVLSDIYENGYAATFALTVFVYLTYRWSNFNIFTIATLTNVGVYIGLGLVYAFIKTYFFGRKKGSTMSEKELKKYYDPEDKWTRDNLLSKLKRNVFRWWFMWPVSLINWVFTDMIRDAYNWCYDKIGKWFVQVFEMGFKK